MVAGFWRREAVANPLALPRGAALASLPGTRRVSTPFDQGLSRGSLCRTTKSERVAAATAGRSPGWEADRNDWILDSTTRPRYNPGTAFPKAGSGSLGLPLLVAKDRTCSLLTAREEWLSAAFRCLACIFPFCSVTESGCWPGGFLSDSLAGWTGTLSTVAGTVPFARCPPFGAVADGTASDRAI